MADLEALLPQNIDSTMISCFRSCKRRFRNEFIFGLRPAGLSIDLHAGACFAAALEDIYTAVWRDNRTLTAALLEAHARFIVRWGDFQIPTWKRTAKTLDNVWHAVETYFHEWHPLTDHIQPLRGPDGTPTIEYTFAIPLEPAVDPRSLVSYHGEYQWPLHPSGEPFLYSGRLDKLGLYGNHPIGCDEKTTGRSIAQSWAEQWDLRSQFIGYTWALQAGGIAADSIAVRGVAIQHTKTDLCEAIKTYSDDLRSRWLEQLRRDLWAIRRCWDEGYFDYNFGEACTTYGNCVFLTPCGAPEADQASWFTNFEVRRWNPILKNPTEAPHAPTLS